MSGQWVYIETTPTNRRHDEPRLFTVGFFDPGGKWHSDSDYLDDSEGAAGRCNYLNGGTTLTPLVEQLLAVIEEMRGAGR